MKVLLTTSIDIGVLTIPSSSELIVADVPGLTLTAGGIVVKGALRLGSASCRLVSKGVTIRLTGVSSGSSYDVRATHFKGIVVEEGGVLELHGQKFAPTWTRLAASATQGATSISLHQPVDWEVGQTIAIMTTQLVDDQYNGHQNEVRVVADVSADGTSI